MSSICGIACTLPNISEVMPGRSGCLGFDDPDRFEQVQRAQAGDLRGGDRLVERHADEALRRQVVDLVGAGAFCSSRMLAPRSVRSYSTRCRFGMVARCRVPRSARN